MKSLVLFLLISHYLVIVTGAFPCQQSPGYANCTIALADDVKAVNSFLQNRTYSSVEIQFVSNVRFRHPLQLQGMFNITIHGNGNTLDASLIFESLLIVQNVAFLQVSQVTIINGVSTMPGVMYLNNISRATFDTLAVRNHISMNKAGAIYAAAVEYLFCNFCTFEGNKALAETGELNDNVQNPAYALL